MNRKFISINVDGLAPTFIEVESDGRFDKIVKLYGKGKKAKPVLVMEDTGAGYNIKLTDNNGTRKLFLNSGDLSDLMIAATILAEHYCLCGPAEYYELKD